MKQIVFGGFLILAGVLGAAVLAAGTMANNTFGNLPFYTVLKLYNLLPLFIFFIAVGLIGTVIGIAGLRDRW